MLRSRKGPLVVLLKAALAIVVFSRIGSIAWIIRSISDGVDRQVFPGLWSNFLLELAVLAGVFFVVKWFIAGDRQDRLRLASIEQHQATTRQVLKELP